MNVRSDMEDEKPLDPSVERVRRKLVRFVVINLGLLFVALMAVVIAIVYRSGTPSEESTPAQMPLEGEIVLPSDSDIVEQSISGDRLLLTVLNDDGSRTLHVYDLTTGQLVKKLAIRFSGN